MPVKNWCHGEEPSRFTFLRSISWSRKEEEGAKEGEACRVERATTPWVIAPELEEAAGSAPELEEAAGSAPEEEAAGSFFCTVPFRLDIAKKYGEVSTTSLKKWV